jgi:hypothetical protein
LYKILTINYILLLFFTLIICKITFSQKYIAIGENSGELEFRISDSSFSYFSDREISSLVFLFPDSFDFSNTYVSINNTKYKLVQNNDVIPEGRFIYSQLISLSIPTSNVTFQINEKLKALNSLKVQLIFRSKKILNIPDYEITNRSKFCEKPEFISSQTWREGLSPPTVKPNTHKVEFAIIHHTAGNNNNTNYTQIVRDIYILHTEVNKYDDIGYNYIIAPNGVIYQGRDALDVAIEEDNVRGAHFCGKNTSTMGIALLGDYTNLSPSILMLESLNKLLSWKLLKEQINPLAMAQHPVNDINASYIGRIAGHREGCATICPGDMVFNQLQEIKNKVNDKMQNCGFVSSQSFEQESYLLFPNPSKGIICLSATYHSNYSYLIYNSKGQNITNTQILNENCINISSLKNGIYYLQLLKDEKFYTQKFIKD